MENTALTYRYHKHQHKEEGQSPVILPVLIYHGDIHWNPDSKPLLVQRLPELLHTYFTDLRFISLDLSLMPTEKIVGIPFLVIHFRTFKHIRGPELLKIVKKSIVLLKVMRLDPDTLEFFEAYVTYLEAAAPKKKLAEIRKVIEKVLMEDDGALLPSYFYPFLNLKRKLSYSATTIFLAGHIGLNNKLLE